MTSRTPHPDSFRLIKLLREHDRRGGGCKDADGKVAGFDHFALMGAGGYRAKLMLEDSPLLCKTLTPRQVNELLQLATAMWMDGVAFGKRLPEDTTHPAEIQESL